MVLGTGGTSEENPHWSPEQGTCIAAVAAKVRDPEQQRIDLNVNQPGYLILRLRSYPAWRITVNSQLIKPVPRDKDGLIAIPVPAGPASVAVDWTTTPDVIVGRVISSLSLVLLVALYWAERKANADPDGMTNTKT